MPARGKKGCARSGFFAHGVKFGRTERIFSARVGFWPHGNKKLAHGAIFARTERSDLLHPQNLRRLFRAAEGELRLVAGLSADELFAER